MHAKSLRLRALSLVAAFAVVAFSGWASADPPSRVARLGFMTGQVSFSPAGENDWTYAQINRPLTTGDRLWTDAGARAEIQIGGAIVRMGPGTGLSVLNLDDQVAQLQLTQGTLNVRVRALGSGQVFEVDTPNLAFTLRQPGAYRITVDADGNATDIVVRNGQGEVYGDGAAYVIDSRQPYRFAGTGLREYQYIEAPRVDEFDRWASERDRGYDTSISARYVSPDVVGYQDLDANGTWRVDATYGNVWIPTRVATGWAPYRDGHWAWVDPWGWTWVDDAPWGFAVSHYGRWTNLRGTWGWVPGPVRARAYYAPALVAFVGGDNFQLTIGTGSVGGVAWFPLGPREVYRPSYQVSRGYFENVNRSNTVVSTTVINNYYSNTNVTNVTYVNRQVPGAVIAVPTTAFVQSQPVARSAVQVSRETTVRGQVAFVAPVAPTEKSVHGAAAKGDKPPARVFERQVVARTAPPAARVGFAAQQQQLAAKPGRPLDDAVRKELKPAAAAPAPAVKVVEQTEKTPPKQRPPREAVGGRPGDAGAKPEKAAKEEQGGRQEKAAKEEQRGQPVAPPQRAAPAAVAPPQAVAPAPAVAQPPEQRGRQEKAAKEEQRGRQEKAAKEEQRGQPVAPPQRAAPAAVAPPQAVAPAPAVAQPPEQRARQEKAAQEEQRGRQEKAAKEEQRGRQEKAAKEEQRGRQEKAAKEEQRGQPVAPPQRAAPAAVAPPQAVAPAPAVAQPPEQRARQEKAAQEEQRGRQEKAAKEEQRAKQEKAAQEEQRGRQEKAAKEEQRAQPVPPPQRAAPAPAAPPQIAATPPAAQQPPQRAKPEPVPGARPPEPRPPAAAPSAAAPPPQAARRAEPRDKEPKPAAGKGDKKKDADEQKQDEEAPKPKG